ncbi:MAG: DUF5682 family protein [Ruminococcus sp.]|nr:DUF5682 family protein [Ruminococcus sp.]
MEKISQFVESAELTLIAESNPLLLFPVRHHSPVCSYQLIRTMELYRPDIVLIEGPSDACELIPVLTDEDTRLPAAIYYFYKDKKKLVSDAAEDYKCYYPFLRSSPEYNALVTAKRLGIEAEFIDLPYSEIMINTAEESGLRRSDKQNYADDSKLTRGEFYRSLCDKTLVRSFEEFWEKYFEIAGLALSPEDFLRQMHTYCCLTRENSDDSEILHDGTDVRERFMAARIIEKMKTHKRVLVVTGGFHSMGLLRLIRSGKAKPPKLHKIPSDQKGAYPAAYSYEAADALHGYASGMEHPFFYDSVFQKIIENGSPDGAYDSASLDFLVNTAKECSKKDIPVSMPDVTAALSLMKGLALLRGVRECGIYELFDGITSTFIKGEKTLSSAIPLDILTKLAVGNGIGHIGDKSHVPPIISDFEKQCAEFRLKYNTAALNTVECGLFTSARGLSLSRFLHRCQYLGTGFCQLVRGADLRENRDRSRVRETWSYHRRPKVDAVLTDHTADGSTIEEACRTVAHKVLDSERSCSRAAQTAVDCFVMGIGIEDEKRLLTDITAADGDFFSVGEGMRFFEMLCRLRELYGYEDNSAEMLVGMCFTKLISSLPSMSGLPSDLADNCIRIMKHMLELTDTLLRERAEELETALRLMISAHDKQPAVYGAAIGLMCRFDNSMRITAEQALRGYLCGSPDVIKQGAEYLKGLFSTARDIMFGENEFLRLTDELINGMEHEDFIAVLPQLRLAFGYFTPQETAETAKAVAMLHSTVFSDIRYGIVIDEKLYSFGKKLDEDIMKHLI